MIQAQTVESMNILLQKDQVYTHGNKCLTREISKSTQTRIPHMREKRGVDGVLI